MKRIKRRAAAALVLAGLIVLGMAFFLYRLSVRGGDWASYRANTHVFKNGNLISAGGRVLGVTAIADTLENAISAAYQKTAQVKFDNGYCRSDIGARAMLALKK